MIEDIVEEHLENAEFLAQQRLANREQKMSCDLAERLHAQLAGLLLSPSLAWRLIEPRLAVPDAAAWYVGARVATACGDSEVLQAFAAAHDVVPPELVAVVAMARHDGSAGSGGREVKDRV